MVGTGGAMSPPAARPQSAEKPASLLLLGAPRTGKTAFFSSVTRRQRLPGDAPPYAPTAGVEFEAVTAGNDGARVTFYDAGGADRTFEGLTTYFSTARGYVLFFRFDSRASWLKMQELYAMLLPYLSGTDETPRVLMVVGVALTASPSRVQVTRDEVDMFLHDPVSRVTEGTYADRESFLVSTAAPRQLPGLVYHEVASLDEMFAEVTQNIPRLVLRSLEDKATYRTRRCAMCIQRAMQVFMSKLRRHQRANEARAAEAADEALERSLWRAVDMQRAAEAKKRRDYTDGALGASAASGTGLDFVTTSHSGGALGALGFLQAQPQREAALRAEADAAQAAADAAARQAAREADRRETLGHIFTHEKGAMEFCINASDSIPVFLFYLSDQPAREESMRLEAVRAHEREVEARRRADRRETLGGFLSSFPLGALDFVSCTVPSAEALAHVTAHPQRHAQVVVDEALARERRRKAAMQEYYADAARGSSAVDLVADVGGPALIALQHVAQPMRAITDAEAEEQSADERAEAAGLVWPGSQPLSAAKLSVGDAVDTAMAGGGARRGRVLEVLPSRAVRVAYGDADTTGVVVPPRSVVRLPAVRGGEEWRTLGGALRYLVRHFHLPAISHLWEGEQGVVHDVIAEHRAATSIQRTYRGWAARQRCTELQYNNLRASMLHNAALTVQAFARELVSTALRTSLYRAAPRVSEGLVLFKPLIAAKQLHALQLMHEQLPFKPIPTAAEHTAATDIQRVWRGQQERRYLPQPRVAMPLRFMLAVAGEREHVLPSLELAAMPVTGLLGQVAQSSEGWGWEVAALACFGDDAALRGVHAQCIQRAVRCFLSRRCVARRRAHAEGIDTAEEELEALYHRRMEQVAAMRIQRAQRCRWARDELRARGSARDAEDLTDRLLDGLVEQLWEEEAEQAARMEREHDMAGRIQRAARQHLARHERQQREAHRAIDEELFMELELLLSSQMDARDNRAAEAIQRATRRYLAAKERVARASILAKEEQLFNYFEAQLFQEVAAAEKIQATARMYIASRERSARAQVTFDEEEMYRIFELKMHREWLEHEAADTIQRSARQFLATREKNARLAVSEEQEAGYELLERQLHREYERQLAAEAIQRGSRTHLAVKERTRRMQQSKEQDEWDALCERSAFRDAERHAAAVTVQRAVRCFGARRAVRDRQQLRDADEEEDDLLERLRFEEYERKFTNPSHIIQRVARRRAAIRRTAALRAAREKAGADDEAYERMLFWCEDKQQEITAYHDKRDRAVRVLQRNMQRILLPRIAQRRVRQLHAKQAADEKTETILEAAAHAQAERAAAVIQSARRGMLTRRARHALALKAQREEAAVMAGELAAFRESAAETIQRAQRSHAAQTTAQRYREYEEINNMRERAMEREAVRLLDTPYLEREAQLNRRFKAHEATKHPTTRPYRYTAALLSSSPTPYPAHVGALAGVRSPLYKCWQSYEDHAYRGGVPLLGGLRRLLECRYGDVVRVDGIWTDAARKEAREQYDDELEHRMRMGRVEQLARWSIVGVFELAKVHAAFSTEEGNARRALAAEWLATIPGEFGLPLWEAEEAVAREELLDEEDDETQTNVELWAYLEHLHLSQKATKIQCLVRRVQARRRVQRMRFERREQRMRRQVSAEFTAALGMLAHEHASHYESVFYAEPARRVVLEKFEFQSRMVLKQQQWDARIPLVPKQLAVLQGIEEATRAGVVEAEQEGWEEWDQLERQSYLVIYKRAVYDRLAAQITPKEPPLAIEVPPILWEEHEEKARFIKLEERSEYGQILRRHKTMLSATSELAHVVKTALKTCVSIFFEEYLARVAWGFHVSDDDVGEEMQNLIDAYEGRTKFSPPVPASLGVGDLEMLGMRPVTRAHTAATADYDDYDLDRSDGGRSPPALFRATTAEESIDGDDVASLTDRHIAGGVRKGSIHIISKLADGGEADADHAHGDMGMMIFTSRPSTKASRGPSRQARRLRAADDAPVAPMPIAEMPPLQALEARCRNALEVEEGIERSMLRKDEAESDTGRRLVVWLKEMQDQRKEDAYQARRERPGTNMFPTLVAGMVREEASRRGEIDRAERKMRRDMVTQELRTRPKPRPNLPALPTVVDKTIPRFANTYTPGIAFSEVPSSLYPEVDWHGIARGPPQQTPLRGPSQLQPLTPAAEQPHPGFAATQPIPAAVRHPSHAVSPNLPPLAPYTMLASAGGSVATPLTPAAARNSAFAAADTQPLPPPRDGVTYTNVSSPPTKLFDTPPTHSLAQGPMEDAADAQGTASTPATDDIEPMRGVSGARALKQLRLDDAAAVNRPPAALAGSGRDAAFVRHRTRDIEPLQHTAMTTRAVEPESERSSIQPTPRVAPVRSGTRPNLTTKQVMRNTTPTALLDLEGLDYSEQELTGYLVALSKNKTIAVLKLGGNKIAGEVCTLLCEILRRPSCTIVSLRLNSCDICEDDAQRLLEALQDNRSVVGIDLMDNPKIDIVTLGQLQDVLAGRRMTKLKDIAATGDPSVGYLPHLSISTISV